MVWMDEAVTVFGRPVRAGSCPARDLTSSTMSILHLTHRISIGFITCARIYLYISTKSVRLAER